VVHRRSGYAAIAEKLNGLDIKPPRNQGQKPQYYVSDVHEPIISRETFDMAQKIRGIRVNTDSPFQGVLKCAECGKPLRRRVGGKKDGKYPEAAWRCDKLHFSQLSETWFRMYFAEYCETDSFDEAAFREKVKEITVSANRILFSFHDGTSLERRYFHKSGVYDGEKQG
jgi:hypothetical protein